MTAIYCETPLASTFDNTISHAQPVLFGPEGRVVGLLLIRHVLAAWLNGADMTHWTAGEVMQSKFVSLQETPNLLHKARIFVQHRIKSLVVTDAKGNLVGCQEPPDIIRAFPSTLLGFFMPVSGVMVRKVATVLPTMSVRQAMELLLERNLSSLVVTDGEKVLGMASESDFLRNLARADKSLVAEIMTAPVHTTPEFYSLGQLWDEMCRNKAMKMPITDMMGDLSGFATSTDILVALSESLLNTFRRYRCPEGVDMLVEWSRDGMIMAASTKVLGLLGCTAEELVGLPWRYGASDERRSQLLALPRDGKCRLPWESGGKTIMFEIERDPEQAVCWWKVVA